MSKINNRIYLFDFDIMRGIDSFTCKESTEDSQMDEEKILSSDGAFEEKWTIAEAIMKCDGRGFSSLPDTRAGCSVNKYLCP